jgi:hypothetical protein
MTLVKMDRLEAAFTKNRLLSRKDFWFFVSRTPQRLRRSFEAGIARTNWSKSS